jgi:hypothetical protein
MAEQAEPPLELEDPANSRTSAIQTGQKRQRIPMTMPKNPTFSMPRPYATRMRGLRKA